MLAGTCAEYAWGRGELLREQGTPLAPVTPPPPATPLEPAAVYGA